MLAALQRQRTAQVSRVMVVTANLSTRCKVASEGNDHAGETGVAYA
jgi:hypothetical protein